MVTQQPTDSREPTSVTVRLVGPFQLEMEPPRRDFTVPAGKGARLLKMLAAASEQTVSINDLIAALWPTDAPAGAARNIAALVSRLRRALGVGAQYLCLLDVDVDALGAHQPVAA